MNIQTAATGSYDYDNQVLKFAGQEWVRVRRLVAPFGVSEKTCQKVVEREGGAFNTDDTRLVELPTEGGVQTVRVFSRSGVRLLAAFISTPEAKHMRGLFARGDDSLFTAAPAPSPQLALPGTHRLPSDTQRVLEELARMIEPDHPAQEAIRGFRDGSRALSADPTVDRLVSRVLDGSEMMSRANRQFAEVRREAERVGYSLEFIKAEARKRRKAA